MSLTIAIAGNPNSGKSTVFNLLTGSNQKVGNWPGVTVDKKIGTIFTDNQKITVVDLPGIYSLNAWSEDERVARDYLLANEASLVVQVVDSTNLERNLYLSKQLQEMGVPLLLVLNMQDLAVKQGLRISAARLSKALDLPVVSISALAKNAKAKIITAVEKFASSGKTRPTYEMQLPHELNEEVDLLSSVLGDLAQKKSWNPQWLALKIIEGDLELENLCVEKNIFDANLIAETRNRILQQQGIHPDEWIAEIRYQQIEASLQHSIKGHHSTPKATLTDKIDGVVLNRWWGLPIFLFIMYMVFWLTINVGEIFIEFFDLSFGAIFVDGLESLLNSWNAPDFFITFFAHGLGTGIQTLATFIPIIFILFLAIAVLESSGYMSRAAFVMDKFMRAIGLPGKAFIPMLVGFGCTVPAIMATRALENKRDRILSVFIVPFMSCGARLPVYVLFAAAFFPGTGQNIVFALYLIGVVLAVITGLLLKGTVYKGELSTFIMELPPYHIPQVSAVLGNAWFRVRSFIRNGGKMLIPIIAILGILNNVGTNGTFGVESQDSVLAAVGKTVTPVFAPMGIKEDNWPAAMGLFTGLFAKEVIVGTLNSLYAQEANTKKVEEEVFSFKEAMGEAFASIPENTWALGKRLIDPLGLSLSSVKESAEGAEALEVDEGIFAAMRDKFDHSKAAAFAFLLFVLLYVPCIATVAVAVKEIGSVLTILQILYATVLGWTLATLTYQIFEGHSLFWIISSIVILMVTVGAIIGYAKKTGEFAET
ncbi:MAG: Fe(2+) transporter permease subunit FeoB [Fibrobacter sp.]|nr:Fe(2+) transporter permease subunit FeoB [Fibrobacter sp.]